MKGKSRSCQQSCLFNVRRPFFWNFSYYPRSKGSRRSDGRFLVGPSRRLIISSHGILMISSFSPGISEVSLILRPALFIVNYAGLVCARTGERVNICMFTKSAAIQFEINSFLIEIIYGCGCFIKAEFLIEGSTWIVNFGSPGSSAAELFKRP